jgi:hypothetical protein
MQKLLGAAAIVLALAAAGRLTVNRRLRRWIRGVLGRSLPGACTVRREEAPTPTIRATTARLEWAEVVNLTAADSASPPRRPDATRESSPVPVETR